LYAVEALSGPEDEPPSAYRGRLLGLDPTTLEVQSEWPLTFAPDRFAVAPDGDHAYALHDGAVVHLDLATGVQARLALLPERGLGLAVTAERVYVSNPYGSEVWAVDRRGGRRVKTIPVGRHPTELVLNRAE
jgi:hypothetical protein